MLRFALTVFVVSTSLAASVGMASHAGAQSPKQGSQDQPGTRPENPGQDRKQPDKVTAPNKPKKKVDSGAAREINFNWRTSVSLNRLRLPEVNDLALRDDRGLAGWSATERLAAALEQVPNFRRSKGGNVRGLDVVLETKIVRSSDSSADLEYRIIDATTGETLLTGTAHAQAKTAYDQATSVRLSGVLESLNGQFFLTDLTTNVRVELRGQNLARFTGMGVQVTGSIIAGAAASAGTTQAVQVATLQSVVRADSTAAAGAAGAAGTGAAGAAGAAAASVSAGTVLVSVGLGAGTVVGIVVARKTNAGVGAAAGAGVVVAIAILPRAIGAVGRGMRTILAGRPKVTATGDLSDLSDLVAAACGSVAGDLAQHLNLEGPKPGR